MFIYYKKERVKRQLNYNKINISAKKNK